MGYNTLIKKSVTKFYANSMWSILVQWIDSGMRETPEELSDLLEELFYISSKFSHERNDEAISEK